MEMKTQALNASFYVTAPCSPSECSFNSLEFFSVPTSPAKKLVGNTSFSHMSGASNMNKNDDEESNFDNFEFETSRKFGCDMEFKTSWKSDWMVYDHHLQQEKLSVYHERRGSLPSMAFADELFCNGQVMPLKPPPRLQHGMDMKSFEERSTPTSPRSPNSGFKILFARRALWDDDFDPFMVALQTVKEEEKLRGRSHETMYNHRRSTSLTPFGSTIPSDTSKAHQAQSQEIDQLEAAQHKSHPRIGRPMELKGSTYSRWVLDQSKHIGLGPTGKSKPKGWFSGRKVRPMKVGQEEPNQTKSKSSQITHSSHKSGEKAQVTSGGNATKMQIVKGFLVRYASFGTENSEGKQTKKPSYFKKLNLKFKGSTTNSGVEKKEKKKLGGEPNMAVVKYKPALCLGYGIESPGSRN